MHVTISRELRLLPCDIALLPTGELFVLLWSAEGFQLDAYDPELALIWSLKLDKQPTGLRPGTDGMPWIIDRTGVSVIDAKGDVVMRRDAPPLEAMELAAVTRVDNEFIFAFQHVSGMRAVPPTVARVTDDNHIRWLAMLETPAIRFDRRTPHGPAHATSQFGPTSWICGYLRPGDLVVSGDSVMLIYTDIRTGIAVGYVVSLDDGALKYVTQRGAIFRAAAYGAGSFVVGHAGFGESGTVLYDRAGHEAARWSSLGYYVVEGEAIRVLEWPSGTSTLNRIVRLRPDGTVSQGDLLEGAETSVPYVHDDGTLYFARAGKLEAVRDLRIEDRVLLCRWPSAGEIGHTRVIASPEGLYTTYSSDDVSGLVRLRL